MQNIRRLGYIQMGQSPLAKNNVPGSLTAFPLCRREVKQMAKMEDQLRTLVEVNRKLLDLFEKTIPKPATVWKPPVQKEVVKPKTEVK